ISGSVTIEVTVEHGAIVEAQVKSAQITLADPHQDGRYDSEARKKMARQFLSEPALENLKTWQFRTEDRATFLVTFVYKIEGQETPLPENPKFELDLPQFVKITVRPFKPSCDDCTPPGDVGTIRPDTPATH